MHSLKYYKGHTDKTKGEGGSKGGKWDCMGLGGGDWWRENADHCN